MALPEIALNNIPNMKVKGIALAIQRGSAKDTKFYPGCTPADAQELAEAIESSGEYTVTGFSVVYRKESYLDGTEQPTNGTASFKDVKWQNVILARQTTDGQELKSLYTLLPVHTKDETKRAALKTTLIGKTIANGKVVAVKENLLSTM